MEVEEKFSHKLVETRRLTLFQILMDISEIYYVLDRGGHLVIIIRYRVGTRFMGILEAY